MYYFCIKCYGQESTTLDYDYVYNLSRSYIKQSNETKKARLSSQLGGIIELDTSECRDIPDSLFIAITNAKEVWESYIPIGAYMKVKIRYVDLDGIDIKTSVSHMLMEDNLNYPQSLFRKLTGANSEKKQYGRESRCNN